MQLREGIRKEKKERVHEGRGKKECNKKGVKRSLFLDVLQRNRIGEKKSRKLGIVCREREECHM
jgi:hypothetical protein